MRAEGTFVVKIDPQADGNPPGVARMALDKQFSGALQASARGTMLAAGDGRTDGAYVALETVTGTLDGREGSFALLHRALMRNGLPEEWTVVVVPGTGAGALAGLDGRMEIVIENGEHRYRFDYSLPDR